MLFHQFYNKSTRPTLTKCCYFVNFTTIRPSKILRLRWKSKCAPEQSVHLTKIRVWDVFHQFVSLLLFTNEPLLDVVRGVFVTRHVYIYRYKYIFPSRLQCATSSFPQSVYPSVPSLSLLSIPFSPRVSTRLSYFPLPTYLFKLCAPQVLSHNVLRETNKKNCLPTPLVAVPLCPCYCNGVSLSPLAMPFISTTVCKPKTVSKVPFVYPFIPSTTLTAIIEKRFQCRSLFFYPFVPSRFLFSIPLSPVYIYIHTYISKQICRSSFALQ